LKHFPWPWLAAAGAGFAIGLTYAWVISPVRAVDITPDTLRTDVKDQYRATIASSYAATGNLERARARLALLGDADPVQELAAQAQRTLAAGASFQIAQELASLASDLRSGSSSVVLPTFTSTPAATPTRSPTPQFTPSSGGPGDLGEVSPTPALATAAPDTPTVRPTRTQAPAPGSAFALLNEDPVCDPALVEGLLQVMVLDDGGHPMPAVEITVTWDGGQERFFTGFKPEISDGYADFVMQPGTSYALIVARAGPPVSGLVAPSCPDAAGQTFLGGLKLKFQQP
jgi:hypothetical protein